MAHVGWARASATETEARSPAVRPRNGPPRDPAAWLILVGRNTAIDEARRRSRQEPLPSDDLISDTDDAEEAVAERLDEEGEVLAPEPSASPGALRLRNAGPLPVVEVYTGPPGGPRGEDRLGADTLPVGGVLEIDPAEAGACAADLVAVFRDGREATRSGVDLCAGEEVEILAGLEEGQPVVASATFLVASESRLRAAFEQW